MTRHGRRQPRKKRWGCAVSAAQQFTRSNLRMDDTNVSVQTVEGTFSEAGDAACFGAATPDRRQAVTRQVVHASDGTRQSGTRSCANHGSARTYTRPRFALSGPFVASSIPFALVCLVGRGCWWRCALPLELGSWGCRGSRLRSLCGAGTGAGAGRVERGKAVTAAKIDP
jgi:hypothetical protein